MQNGDGEVQHLRVEPHIAEHCQPNDEVQRGTAPVAQHTTGVGMSRAESAISGPELLGAEQKRPKFPLPAKPSSRKLAYLHNRRPLRVTDISRNVLTPFR
jgi:hypothetical protein